MSYNIVNISIFIAIIAATILIAFLVNKFFKRLIHHASNSLVGIGGYCRGESKTEIR